jgi:hypothetical protein
MDNTIRHGVTDYLSLTINNEKADTMVKEQVLEDFDYPLFVRSFNILKPLFEDFMVVEQAYFWYDKNVNKIFQIMERIIQKDSPKLIEGVKGLKQEVLGVTVGSLRGFPANKEAPNRKVQSNTSKNESDLSYDRWNMIRSNKVKPNHGLNSREKSSSASCTQSLMPMYLPRLTIFSSAHSTSTRVQVRSPSHWLISTISR